jgi:hypothetical protein
MQRTSGDVAVILSQIIVPSEDDCASASLTPAQCSNVDVPVITHRIAFGNTGIKSSAFGTPPSGLANSAGSIAPTDYLTNSGVRAAGFEDALDLAEGEVAYVAEVFAQSPSWSVGAGSLMGVYARAIY